MEKEEKLIRIKELGKNEVTLRMISELGKRVEKLEEVMLQVERCVGDIHYLPKKREEDAKTKGA